jgi:hypothetical protein
MNNFSDPDSMQTTNPAPWGRSPFQDRAETLSHWTKTTAKFLAHSAALTRISFATLKSPQSEFAPPTVGAPEAKEAA